MRFDELNTPITTYEYVDFQKYFAPMQITEEQKEKRTETAHDLFFDFLMLFALIQQSIEDGDLDYLFILQQFQDMYADTVSKYARTDDYTREYVDSFTRETMDTTWSHLDLSDENSYWLSNERASILALNESNTINNYEEFQKAIDDGMNVKIWKTQKDNRVRDSHRELEGQKIGINEYFHVGSSELLFPRDYVHCSNIRDIAGCRCYAKTAYDPKFEEVTKEEHKTLSPGRHDVTNEYKTNATPNSGKKTKDKNFVDVEGEEEMGNYVYSTFGGNIRFLEEKNEDDFNPDYLWNGKYWDLKTTSTELSANSAIRKGLKQIRNNPGGVMLNYVGRNINEEKLLEVMDKRMQWCNYSSVDIMARFDDFYKVWRYIK